MNANFSQLEPRGVKKSSKDFFKVGKREEHSEHSLNRGKKKELTDHVDVNIGNCWIC